jgi:hypothetical protein
MICRRSSNISTTLAGYLARKTGAGSLGFVGLRGVEDADLALRIRYLNSIRVEALPQ